jgi:hypothetical protein
VSATLCEQRHDSAWAAALERHSVLRVIGMIAVVGGSTVGVLVPLFYVYSRAIFLHWLNDRREIDMRTFRTNKLPIISGVEFRIRGIHRALYPPNKRRCGGCRVQPDPLSALWWATYVQLRTEEPLPEPFPSTQALFVNLRKISRRKVRICLILRQGTEQQITCTRLTIRVCRPKTMKQALALRGTLARYLSMLWLRARARYALE